MGGRFQGGATHQAPTAPFSVVDVTDVPWRWRLYAHPLGHRLVPLPVADAAVRAFARRKTRRDAARLEEHRTAMAAVVGSTTPVADPDRVALRHAEEDASRNLRLWRPWLFEGARLEGFEHVRGAWVPGRRGVLLTFVHLDAFFGISRAVATRSSHPAPGVRALVPAADFTPEGTVRGSFGLILRQHQLLAILAGIELLPAPGSYPVLRQALIEGHSVTVAFDVAGSKPTRWFGRTVGLASGTARLAHETGSAVVAIGMHRDGRGRPIVRFREPFEPGDYPSADAMHAAIAAHFEEQVLAGPEAFEHPLWRWRELEVAGDG